MRRGFHHRANYGDGSVNVPRSAAAPTREHWQDHKNVIIAQYIDQRKDLNDVVHNMSTQYGFNATPRMFKTRFAAWGVQKYRMKPQARATRARLSATYRPKRATSAVTTAKACPSLISEVNDLDYPEIDESWTGADWALESADSHALINEDDGGFDPLASSTFSFPILSRWISLLRTTDEIVVCVRQFSSSWDARAHPHNIPDAPAQAAKLTSGIVGHCAHRYSPDQCERCTWAEFDYGLAMLQAGQRDAAFRSFGLGCKLTRLLLSSPSKLFIRNLIMAFGSNRWDAYKDVRRKLLEHLAGMALAILKDRHPITRILMSIVDGDLLKASAEASLTEMINVFEGSTVSANPDVLLIKRSLSIILRRQQKYDESERVLLQAIAISETKNGLDHKETRRCLRRLVHLYMERGRFHEAEAICHKILRTSPARNYPQERRFPDELSVYTYQHLAQIAIAMGDFEKCKLWFSKELAAAIKRWGPTGEYSAECIQLASQVYGLTPGSLSSQVQEYPQILQGEKVLLHGRLVISKLRWCAVRNLI